jgi:hypothetical protein
VNALRLIFGWVFLAGLTAAGTFYGMDEVDSRVGLASLHLHDKFGIARYAAAAKTVVTPPVTVIPGPSGPTTTDTDPHTPDGSPVTPLVPPSDPVTPPPTAPDYGRPVTPAPTYPPPYRSTPAVYPPRSSPTGPSGAPTRAPEPGPGPRPRDYNEVNDRLTDVKGRAEGVLNSWAGIQRSLSQQHLPLRPAISAALSSLRSYTLQAEQALRTGDTATARHDLDQAEKQMQILQQYQDQ